jgi:hypothetical protein
MKQVFEIYRLVNNNGKIVESSSVNDRDAIQRNLNGRLGFDLQAGPKTLIGAEISAYDNKWSMDAESNSVISLDHKQDTIVSITDAEINQWKKYGGSINVQHTVKKDETISFEYDHDHYRDNNPNNYVNSYFTGSGSFLYEQKLNSEKATPITISVLSTDYSKRINTNTELAAGLKYSVYRFTNDVAVNRFIQNLWSNDKEFTSKYFLKENIAAAYASLNINVTAKNTIKAGLRYEYTTSNLASALVSNIVNRKYGKLFPSLFLSHKINDDNSLNISYSMRISRPTFRDLAPFVYFVDPNTYISGNSALQPAISNSARLSYTYKKYLFAFSYSSEKDFIASFQSRVNAATNKQYLMAENYPSIHTASVTISLPFTPASWWNMQNNISARWQQVNAVYNNQSLQLEQKNFNLASTQTFRLPGNYCFELKGFYSSPGLAGTYLFRASAGLNAGIQKKLKGQNGKFSFNVNDVFSSSVAKFSINLPAQNLVTNGSLRF